ncbi:MAG: aminotransferase class I/II-fold pyridoxal phosphate-dependent enzyme [Roseburia sp.]|nr:aminotransferase class I/II-fold pyridoxal phosphate-dependent enzyme [Anaeroplasma bactoclasticum]MCM1196602.1 aminotransferase class I/II-fold pyridoxal phosphate-dependent enzyme [Roseburia sp.]
MKLLANHSILKEDRSNILVLGGIAKEMKAKDSSVVNATIGMLYDEKGKLFTFQSVDEVLKNLTAEEKYAYSSTPGNKDYHEALKRWIFKDYYDEMLSSMRCSVIATPGGTGAIANTFANYLNPKDMVLLPDYMWGNYKQMAYECFAEFTTYSLFEENHFNLKSVENKILELKAKQKRVVLVVNDPCHNPTGYTMSYEEWQNLIEIINRATEDGMPFVLLYDMAYIDYDSRGFDATRKNIRLFQRLNSSVLVILAFSGSKTMALYGLRIGAQVALAKEQSVIDEFTPANAFSARTKWSMATNLGMHLVSKVLLTEEYRSLFEKELRQASSMLTARANTFIEESKKVGLKTLSFMCGFFITIPCQNPDDVYKRLVERKIHIVPLDNVLRVTIAAISLEECRRLPKEIKVAIDATLE